MRAINHQHSQACAESASKCATRLRVEVSIFDLVILEINWKLHQAAGAQEVVDKKINPLNTGYGPSVYIALRSRELNNECSQ